MASTAPSPLAGSLQKTNGAKLSRLLIDGGTTILRNIYDHHHPPANLAASLNAKRSILNRLRNRRILNAHQWNKLFPPGGAAPDSNTFDITLLFVLLTNICGLSRPLSGWHRMPPSSDTSLEANLARIKAYRNELYGHVTTTGIQTAAFNVKWQEVSGVLVSLGLSQPEVDRLKAEPSVEDYIDAVTEWTKSDEEIKLQLKELLRNQDKVIRNQQDQHSTLESLQKVTREGFEDLKKRKELDRAAEALKHLVKSEFRGDIEYHAQKFQKGTREWIFKNVERWLDDRSSLNRVMVISGNAGMGKTVISAVLSKRMQEAGRLLGSHFCQHNNARYRNPQLMLQSLASHMSHSMPEYKYTLVEQLSRNLGKDLNSMGVEELFALLFKEPLNALTDPGRNFLLVIDGLDESEYQGRNELLDVIGSQFCKLPVWIRFLVTTRPETSIVTALKHLNPFQLEQNQEENLKDIQVLFEMKLTQQIRDENKSVFLKEFVKKSEGLFLYARLLIDFIQRNVSSLNLEQLESTLPEGISSVYLSYFARLEKELRNELKVDEEHILRFLCAMTASREPLPIEFVFSLWSPSGKSLTAQRRVNKAIACISALLPIRDGRIHFFHKSVKDWLTDAPCYGQHDFTVDEKEGHEILFNLCTTELDNIKRKGVHDVTQFSSTEKYALQHSVQHMLEMADWSDKVGTSNSKEELVDQYVMDLELIYARLHVNNAAASKDLVSIQNQVKAGLLSGQGHSVLNSLLVILRKHLYVLRDYPHLFFQCLHNEGDPELSSEAAKILEDLPNIPYMEYVDKKAHEGADQARFYCSDKVACFDVSPEMGYVVCECRDGTIHLWSLETGNTEWVRPSLTKRKFYDGNPRDTAYRQVKNCLSLYRCTVFHPSGKSILPGTLQQVYTLNGELKDLFPASACTFSNCAFTGDKKKILTDCVDESKALILWNMEDGKQLLRLNWTEEISCLAISQDGSLIALSDFTGYVFLFDPTMRSSKRVLLFHGWVCGLINFTSNDTLVCGFLYLTLKDIVPGRYEYFFSSKPQRTFLTSVKDQTALPAAFHQLESTDSESFVLWPSAPGRLAQSDQFWSQETIYPWVKEVHRVVPSLDAGSYIELSDEIVLIGSPACNYLTIINTGLLHKLSYSVNYTGKFVEKVVYSVEGDAIYSIVGSSGSVSFSGDVEITIWRMSSQEIITERTFTGLMFLIPTTKGVVILKKDKAAELWNFELSKIIRTLTKLKGAQFKDASPISGSLIACWPAESVLVYIFDVDSEKFESQVTAEVDGSEDCIDDCIEDYSEDYREDYIEDCIEDYIEDFREDYIEDCIEDYIEDYSEDCIEDYIGDYIEDFREDYIEDCIEDYIGDYNEDYIEDFREDYIEDCIEDYIEDYSKDYIEDYSEDCIEDYIGDYIEDFREDYIEDCIEDYIEDFREDYIEDCIEDYIEDYREDYMEDYREDYIEDYIEDYREDYIEDYSEDCIEDYIGDYNEDYIEDCIEDYIEDFSEGHFEDYSEDCILLVSSNSQHQLLTCTSKYIGHDLYKKEVITVSLRSNGSVLWKRLVKWIVTPSCSDPHMIFSPKDEFVVTWNTLSCGQGLHVLDAKTGETCHVFFENETKEHIVDCKFVDDESLVSCSRDNFLRLFDIRTGQLLSLLDIGERPFCLGACLYQPLVAVGLYNSRLKFIHVQLPADRQNKKGSSTRQKGLEKVLRGYH